MNVLFYCALSILDYIRPFTLPHSVLTKCFFNAANMHIYRKCSCTFYIPAKKTPTRSTHHILTRPIKHRAASEYRFLHNHCHLLASHTNYIAEPNITTAKQMFFSRGHTLSVYQNDIYSQFSRYTRIVHSYTQCFRLNNN